MSLAKQRVLSGRGMVKKTFISRGLPYASELAILNINDTLKILKWNAEKNIRVFRMGSDIFPWSSEYRLSELPNFSLICTMLRDIGTYIKSENIRVSFHPGPFNVLASENKLVVKKTIYELNTHSEIFDLMDIPATHYYPINIHVSTSRPTHHDAMQRFCENFELLSNSCKRRLTVENDDSENRYSVKMLYDGVYRRIGIPIVFDQLHFMCGKQDQTNQDALELALSTWGDITPLTHMSSSKLIETKNVRKSAHADYIYEKIPTFGYKFDTELECKQKELALLKYLDCFIK